MKLFEALFIFSTSLYCVSGTGGILKGNSGLRAGSFFNSGSESGIRDVKDKEKNKYSEQACTSNGYSGHFLFGYCQAFCHGNPNKPSNFYNLPDGAPCYFGEKKCEAGICGGSKEEDKRVKGVLDNFIELVFLDDTQNDYLDSTTLEKARKGFYNLFPGRETIVDNALNMLLFRAKQTQ